MLDTLQEIQENHIVNNFKETAKNYGLHGTYVNWQPGGLNEGGVYFVCGLDKGRIYDRDIDMFRILDDQKKSRNYLCTDINAFRITGEHPLMLQRDFINYCHELDAAQKVYKHFGKEVPTRVSKAVLETMRMTWENFTEPQKDIQVRQKYEKMLFHIITVEEEGIDPSDPKYKKNNYLSHGYYDSDKGKVYNWFKMHFHKYKNEVSLPHLLAQAGRISSAQITYRNFKAIKKCLQQRPDILYTFSDVKGGVLNVADPECYGSKENNDRRFFTLYYPASCAKDIENIIYQINYPEEYNRSLSDIDPLGFGTEHVVVPVEYYNMLKKSCDEVGIRFCIDKTAHDVISGGVPIAFAAKDSIAAYSFLSNIVKASEAHQLKSPQQTQTLPGSSLDDLIQSLKNTVPHQTIRGNSTPNAFFDER